MLTVFSIRLVSSDESLIAILSTLDSLLGPTKVAPGCMSARLYTDLKQSNALFFVEEWASREQFEKNLDTAKLRTIVAAIELSSQAPVVRVDLVEREEGVDALAAYLNPGAVPPITPTH
jgi:quinol monooxygenase YgiN